MHLFNFYGIILSTKEVIMQNIKPIFENQPITEVDVKDPNEAINNVKQIIEVKQNSIEDNNTQIDNLEFAKLLRKLVKIFGFLGSVILTTICILFTKDIVVTSCTFGSIMLLGISFIRGTKSNKVIEKEIRILNLDIQHELSEIEDLENEIAYLQSLIVNSQSMDQASINFDNDQTIQQIKPITAYPERTHKPKSRTRTLDEISYNKENNN